MDRPQGLIDLDFRLRRAGLVLLYLIIACVAAMMLYYAKPFIRFSLTVLSPFIVSLIIAYMFNPVVNWLQKRFSLGRIGGVLITYALILTITVGFFAILLPILYTQLRASIGNLVTNFPQILDRATLWLKLRISPEEMAQAKAYMSSHFDIADLTGRAGSALNQAVDTTKLITRMVGTTVGLVIGFFAFVSFVVVIVFYFLLDYNRIEHIARVLLPDDQEGRVFRIWAKIDTALGGFLRGQLIVATTVGILYSMALFAMGMREYAILVGFLAGFGNLIPYLGPVLGGVPAGLWVLFGHTWDGSQKMVGLGLVVLLSVAIQSLDGFFLQPRVVGKNAELHPLLVLLALLIGAQFGLGGMIIAVPLAIMVRVVVKELWWDPLERIEFANKQAAGALQQGTAPSPEPMPNLPAVVEQRPETNQTVSLETREPDMNAPPPPSSAAAPEKPDNSPPSRPRRRRRR